jgi:GNAT superfamily N-acetyltransferase
MTGDPPPRDLDGADARETTAAAGLLAQSVPAEVAGLVPYSLKGYGRYLSAVLAPAAPLRTVVVRTVIRGGVLAAVADWRLLDAGLFLNGLAVDPGYRRRGLGRLLLADGVASAGRLGISLDVAAGNGPAVALYQGAGFADSAVSAWQRVAVRGRSAGGRLVDWPVFAATRSAYGFADLTVRLTTGAVSTVRVIGDAIRLHPDEHRDLPLATLCAVTGCTRAYAIHPLGTTRQPDTGPAPASIARFVRMVRAGGPGTRP